MAPPPVKWTLYDPVGPESYTFSINPNEGGSPVFQKNITEQATTAPGGRTLLFEGADAPQKLEFSGTLLDQSQYDAFTHWWAKRRQVRLTDDLNRTFWIYITSFESTRKRVAPPNNQYKHSYKVSSIILSWSS